MKGSSDNFVSTSQHADAELSDNINELENNDEDPLRSAGVCVSEKKYYKLDQVVFAEPIEEVETSNNLEETDDEDVGELTFIDNVVIKKRMGKRNKYIIDMENGSLSCPVSTCTQQFSTTTLLKAHIRKVHCATAKYICEGCGAAFTAPYLLKRHSAVHDGRRVQCTVCSKWLSQRTSLSAHLRTHTVARPHACAACHKAFPRRSSLGRHVKFVHKEGDLSCDSCGETFATRVQWTRHQATHKH